MQARNAPRICRWVVAAASRLVPRRLRPTWKRRWDSEVWNWWAFLAEHGAFDRDARAQLVRHSWGAFPDAVRTRWGESGARVLAFLGSPALCLAIAAFPLLIALWTGLPGLRALVEPLPYHRPDRLVLLSHTSHPLSLDNANLAGWRRALRLQGFAAYTAGESRMDGLTLVHGRAEAGFFDLLGTRAALGRVSAGDEAGLPSVVISHRLWRLKFGADPAALGRTVHLDGRPYRVIGVTPPEFWFYRRDVAVWTVLELPGAVHSARYGAVARLKDYARQRDTELELSNIAWEQSPRDGVWVQVLPIAERLNFAGRYYLALWIAATGVALVCGMVGFRGSRRSVVFLTIKAALVVAGLAACAIELPARTATVIAGRAYGVEIWFAIAAGLAIWWGWHDQRRRCRVCLRRLTLPVSFGNWGSPLLDRVGTELVCPQGHGTLYIPGMHWSSSEPERWTNFDDSYNDLFTGQGPPPA